MPISVACEAGAPLTRALEALLPEEPNLAYANFLPVAQRAGAAEALHQARFAATAEGDGEVWVARDGAGEPLAALRTEPRPFESEHLRLRMAKIEEPVARTDEATREPALRALYAALLARLWETGTEHVAARASTRDRTAGWMLQEQGGFHVDTQVSWMAALTSQPADEAVSPPLRIEVVEGARFRELEPSSWKRLAHWSARAFDRGPLVFDRSLDHERTLAVYRVWTEKVMRGEWADAVLVAWDGPEIVAFISMLEMDDVSKAAGSGVCGRGLGATLPDYRGLFTAIQREMIAARPLAASYMENETQVATIGSINVYAKLGFRFLRSTSTYHLRPPFALSSGPS